MKSWHLFSMLPFLFLLNYCTTDTPPQTKDGGLSLEEFFSPEEPGIQNGGVKVIPIKTEVGSFNVWTRRIGNNPQLKVLLLHGGPGATHEYLECVQSFFPAKGIEIIYYDQLGSGNSDHPEGQSEAL